MTIRVLLADDQALIRAGFAAIIDSTEDLEVVGEASNGTEAVRLAQTLHPDVVLMDIRMPGLDGIGATEAIMTDPDTASTKVLVLTTFEADEYVLAAIRAGASGFLGKSVEPTDLLDGIRVVASGDALLSPKATTSLIARYLSLPDPVEHVVHPGFSGLTERETELVILVAQGRSNEEIAAELFLSPLTVKTHINRAMAKVHVHDRAQLVVLAYRSGLVRVGDPDSP